jgi:hypothetical protein
VRRRKRMLWQHCRRHGVPNRRIGNVECCLRPNLGVEPDDMTPNLSKHLLLLFAAHPDHLCRRLHVRGRDEKSGREGLPLRPSGTQFGRGINVLRLLCVYELSGCRVECFGLRWRIGERVRFGGYRASGFIYDGCGVPRRASSTSRYPDTLRRRAVTGVGSLLSGLVFRLHPC